MPRFSLRLALLSLTAPLCACLAVAAPKWNTLQAPHCLIVSQLNERETRAWAAEFEQFTAALRNKILIEEAFLPPLTVVLFADQGQFGPYCPRDDKGKKRELAGVFATRDTWGTIGLANGFSDESTRHTVLHEATHWHVSATRTEMPLWLNEGFAEAFSTFKAKKDHGLLGEPIPYHLPALRGETWVPLFQLMLTSGNDRLYTDSKRNHQFYAQSWIFAHKLLFENPAKGHEILNRFYQERVRGADQLAAFRTAFGRELEAVQDELERYVRNGQFTFERLPFPAEAKITAAFTPASPLAVETALARLAIGTRRCELARQHLGRALALAPEDTAAHELLARLELESDNNPAAVAAAEKALALGSRDAWMHLTVAQELWRKQSDRGTLDTAARTIVDHYAQAVALQPKLRHAYLSIASLAPLLPTVTTDDAKVLAAGYRIFPDAPWLLVGIAAILHKGNNPSEADRFIGLALARPELLNQEQRSEAERLRVRWQSEPLEKNINALAKERRFREALAEFDKLLALPLPLQTRKNFENWQASLRFSATIADAQAAAQDGRATEAVRLLEDLLAQPNLSPRDQAQARKFLDSIRSRTAHENRQDRRAHIENLCRDLRFDEAIAEYDRWLAELPEGFEREGLVKARARVEFFKDLGQVQAADEAGKPAEAKRRLDELCRQRQLDPQQRSIVDEIEAHLRRQLAKTRSP